MKYLKQSTLESPGTVIIDDRDSERAAQRTLVFSDPTEVLVARSAEEVADAIDRIDSFLASGKHLAGYFAYDAGLVLDKPIESRHAPNLSLIWLGVYDGYAELDAGELEFGSAYDISEPRLNVTEDEYIRCIDRIRDYIAAGDVYQVNYTVKLIFEHAQPAWRMFARLRQAHPVGYSAFINTGDAQIVSISPELFLRREGDTVLTRPMKGTARRGRWFEEDSEIAGQLAADPKNRAENIMIVDLMRNDLGRVCEMGGVRVPRMFHVERYGSLFQMTSDVEGRLREGVTTSELIRAVFPPGSITGAPKIRAMEIIDELEHESRGAYCGCIGYLRPDGNCLLNVAIRTIVQRGDQCEMGVGSGVVTDSDPQSEFNETLLKGEFVKSEPARFELLETLLYRESRYVLLAEHLTRMRQSAEYFGWPFPEADLRKSLDAAAADIAPRSVISNAVRNLLCPEGGQKQISRTARNDVTNTDELASGAARVRLLLSSDGSCRAEWADAGAPVVRPVQLILVSRRTDPSDIFLYHKTTDRQAYDDELHDARTRGFFDALHLNTRGELTEGSVTNLAVEIDGRWCTPPLDCGLLPGIWRADALSKGEATERILTLDDLLRATSVRVGNSVRGPIAVRSIVDCDGKALFG
jgi:para-aminobenzoate synthetase/4-amino-4-deoxychorismate lyase